MKRWKIYFQLECKKMIKTVPALLTGMILFILLVSGVLIFSHTVMESSRKEFQTVQVGIVGSKDDKYTNLAVSIVEKMETVQYSCKFDYCSKQEAEEGLKDGTYDVIFLIPKDYVKGFMNGENKTIVARFGKGQTDVTSYVMKQLADFAGELLIETEKNIYSMQDYYREKELEDERQEVIDINLEYFKQILARANVFTTEEVTRTDGLSTVKYYFCDAIVLIFLFLGLQCAKILQKNPLELEAKLKNAGVGATKQILAKLFAFICTLFVIYLVLGVLLMPGFSMAEKNGFVIIEGSMWMQVLTLLKISLILLPTCAFILLIYEIFEESVNGILLLFVASLVLAFTAGCFYPLSFLPKQIQFFSQFTVTRAMFSYVIDCVEGETFGAWGMIMMIHAVVLTGLSVLMRFSKIKREKQ